MQLLHLATRGLWETGTAASGTLNLLNGFWEQLCGPWRWVMEHSKSRSCWPWKWIADQDALWNLSTHVAGSRNQQPCVCTCSCMMCNVSWRTVSTEPWLHLTAPSIHHPNPFQNIRARNTIPSGSLHPNHSLSSTPSLPSPLRCRHPSSSPSHPFNPSPPPSLVISISQSSQSASQG